MSGKRHGILGKSKKTGAGGGKNSCPFCGGKIPDISSSNGNGDIVQCTRCKRLIPMEEIRNIEKAGSVIKKMENNPFSTLAIEINEKTGDYEISVTPSHLFQP